MSNLNCMNKKTPWVSTPYKASSWLRVHSTYLFYSSCNEDHHNFTLAPSETSPPYIVVQKNTIFSSYGCTMIFTVSMQWPSTHLLMALGTQTNASITYRSTGTGKHHSGSSSMDTRWWHILKESPDPQHRSTETETASPEKLKLDTR